MQSPPYKCLFCSTTKEAFTHVEHAIPESLGNDDKIIEPGFVCDKCNQYFGSKIENRVLNAVPFGIERVRFNIKTKKGKYPTFSILPHIQIFPTGYKDHLIIAASKEYWDFVEKNSFLMFPHSVNIDILLIRLMLKMGLELLLFKNYPNPYNSKFDNARKFARSPVIGSNWQMAYGLYPYSKDLFISQREDDISTLETDQLYRYEIGIMSNGDVIFFFMYRVHLFACNLSNHSIEDYTNKFNVINSYKLDVLNLIIK